MIVLHIIESLSGVGGTPRKLLYLVKHSKTEKCRHIFVCYMPSPLKNEFERYGAVVECLNTVSPLKIIRHVQKTVERNNVDVICTHFTRPMFIGFFAALSKRLPVIHNEHSSASYRKGIGRILSRLLLPRVQAVTCNSHYTLESVYQEFSVQKNRMIVLHNPVEQRGGETGKVDLRILLGFEKDALIIGHVGGMISQRNQQSLVQAFSRLKKNHPNARLIIIGDGRLREELENLTRQLGLKEAVLFTGYTDQVGDYLRVMDIYVNPTLDEGFGIAVVEAMLESLPVVLSDQGAHPELVEDGVSGILYSGGDSQSLFEKLQWLANDSETRKALGFRAKKRALENFSPKTYAEKYLRIVSETVNSSRSKINRSRY